MYVMWWGVTYNFEVKSLCEWCVPTLIVVAFQGGTSLACWALGSRNWDKINRLYWASTFKSIHPPGKDCILGIICRILQQSYGDSDDSRQSQTACSSLDVLYWNKRISDSCVISTISLHYTKNWWKENWKWRYKVFWDATLYQVGTRISDKHSASIFRVKQLRTRIYFIAYQNSHLPYICSSGEVCVRKPFWMCPLIITHISSRARHILESVIGIIFMFVIY
jgi:hypothetical protein